MARHTRQAINRAVNQFYTDHPGCQVAHEKLNRVGMRFKSRRLNAYLSASQLGWIPKQLVWGAKKRGVTIHAVQAAYTSQECPEYHFVSRSNRPRHQTFCCQVCRLTDQADRVAARNIQSRHGDADIHHCRTIDDIKAVLQQRHQAYCNWVGRSPTARVRRVAHLCIPGAAGMDLEECSWINGLPGGENQREQEHAAEVRTI